jgi:hypothetical protein
VGGAAAEPAERLGRLPALLPDGTNAGQKCHIDANGTLVSGSDFAESLPARGARAAYEPGDVLSMSRARPGQVVKAQHARDRALIGVYSTRPAVLGADRGGVTRVGSGTGDECWP